MQKGYRPGSAKGNASGRSGVRGMLSRVRCVRSLHAGHQPIAIAQAKLPQVTAERFAQGAERQ
jgi:hypothetical protein